ncbi:nucleotidyltransferase family protein [Mameliella alba]|uniref:Nucleotidyltransferase family protein n=1 Tax=Mameliella alba TaxID=561184 RepID=A0A0B3RTP5_9RHOB|nr:nucleotidyltransferase family protein [Mameliella alba]KHQ50143.1 hypothetical protein OA50_05262 [Mameliella alba]
MTRPVTSESFADSDLWISACLHNMTGDAQPSPLPDIKSLVSRMIYHGVVGTIAESPVLMRNLPDDLTRAMQVVVRGLAVRELAHRHILVRLASSFAAQGIVPVVLKGTALAYSVYDKPTLRPRGDTDIVVAEMDFQRAQEVLKAHGFSLAFAPCGAIVSSQCSYVLQDKHGVRHVIDLHRQTNNHAALANLFPYDELRSRAKPLDRLSSVFLRPDFIDAMLFACYHRFMHIDAPIIVGGDMHLNENRLIWLLDLAHIGQTFSEHDWETLVTRAGEKGLLRICHDSLVAARDNAGLDLPDTVLEALKAAPLDEAPLRFLQTGRAGQLLANLAATPGLGQKFGYLRETAFPPPAYMHAAFGMAGQTESLPLLYLRRAIRGLGTLTRNKGSGL